MCTSLMGAPRLANILLVLLIANFTVALSPVINDTTLHRSSSNFDAADPSNRENLAYLPARWRLISPSELQLTEIEIPLFKRHVQEDKNNLWAASTEYKYSSQNHNIGSRDASDKNTPKPDEKSDVVKRESDVSSVEKKREIPIRYLFDLPHRECHPGQRRDRNGRCRNV